jgi:hypothetical protein
MTGNYMYKLGEWNSIIIPFTKLKCIVSKRREDLLPVCVSFPQTQQFRIMSRKAKQRKYSLNTEYWIASQHFVSDSFIDVTGRTLTNVNVLILNAAHTKVKFSKPLHMQNRTCETESE